MEYLIIIIGSLGWPLAFHYRKMVKFLRKEFIKVSILRGIDCSSECSEEEYREAEEEVFNHLNEIRKRQ